MGTAEKDMQELAISYPGTNIIGSGGNINKLYRLAEKKDKKNSELQWKYCTNYMKA